MTNVKTWTSASGFILALALTSAHAQDEAAIPDIAQALLDAAYETGDPGEIAAVANAVAKVFPDFGKPVIADAEARIAALAPPDPELEPAPEEPDQPRGVFGLGGWTGEINAGASFASGNSDNLAAGMSFKAALDTGDFINNVTGYIDLAESDGLTTQKRWGLAYKLDYKISNSTFAFARIAYDEDEFSGFDYRLFGGLGLGHFFYKSKAFTWKIEGGPGYRFSPIDLTREVEEDFAVFAATEIDWLIRDGLSFEQDMNVTWTSPTTTIQSISALRTKLTKQFSTTLSFEFRYETDPPMGRVNADQIARASLVYGF